MVSTRIDTSFHSSPSTMRLPTNPTTTSATFKLPPIASSSPRRSSYTPHSGNIPHTFGTDHLTTATLKQENTDLVSAFAQAQIYLADLDTKIQVSHAENEKLANERQRLMGRIEILEAQLEELEHGIQQTQKHSAAKDAQYSRIMELSTRLQSQGAAEAQSRMAEQHGWSSEKKYMQSVIDSLKNEVNGLRKAYAKFTSLTPSSMDSFANRIDGETDSAVESSSHGLLAEREALRRTNARLEEALAGVRGDNIQLAKYVEKLGSVEQNIQMRLQKAETGKRTLDTLDNKGATEKERGFIVED